MGPAIRSSPASKTLKSHNCGEWPRFQRPSTRRSSRGTLGSSQRGTVVEIFHLLLHTPHPAHEGADGCKDSTDQSNSSELPDGLCTITALQLHQAKDKETSCIPHMPWRVPGRHSSRSFCGISSQFQCSQEVNILKARISALGQRREASDSYSDALDTRD